MRAQTFAKSGFTIIDTLVVVVLVIIVFGFAIVLSVPRHQYSSYHCVSNLKQVGLAFRIWEGDNGDKYPMSVLTNKVGAPLYTAAGESFHYFQVMSNELSNPKILVCPADTSRIAPTNFFSDFNDRHISYFIGLVADETNPQLFLAGDSNLTNGTPLTGCVLTVTAAKPATWHKPRHDHGGNIALADGSVQQYDNAALHKYIREHSTQTNRLLMPLP